MNGNLLIAVPQTLLSIIAGVDQGYLDAPIATSMSPVQAALLALAKELDDTMVVSNAIEERISAVVYVWTMGIIKSLVDLVLIVACSLPKVLKLVIASKHTALITFLCAGTYLYPQGYFHSSSALPSSP